VTSFRPSRYGAAAPAPPRRGRAWRAALVALALVPAWAAAQEVAAAIRERLASGTPVLGVELGARPVVAGFYAAREYAPAWEDAGRRDEFLGILAAAPEHGLDPADFLYPRLAELPAEPAGDAARADRDLLFTEALVRYGYTRRFGKVNPEELEPHWNFERGFAEGQDPVGALAAAIAAPALGPWLDEKIPGGPWYRQLQVALARYRAIAAAGDWPVVPDGPVLRPGELDPRVPVLRARLAAEGGLPAGAPPPAEPQRLDEDLARMLMAFQARHALAADGVLGPRTLQALNVPVAGRLDQLRMSLERVRWLSGGTPDRYVVVNVAGFRVGYVRDRRLAWQSRVVVGRAARQTPIFRDTMTYVELNPTWTVPPTILRQDILPKVQKDPGYLRRENITVIGRDGRAVDPATVNWAAFRGSVPYTLRQEPGPRNALGRIKLMFPNEHAVYLHDTPAKELFEEPERTFSSGCIRVEDPLALAELVLDDPAWTRASLEAAIAEGRTRRVSLKRPVPVLLVYLTAVADADGTARFYRDIYGRDEALRLALDGPVRLDLPRPDLARAGGKVRPAPL
jgi:murein L,D-transpeptidase YcbB/YkuD